MNMCWGGTQIAQRSPGLTCQIRSCCLLAAKHHTRTLQSSIQLRRNSPPETSHVMVAGGEDASVYARQHGDPLPPNVKHLGRVNDDDLAYLYRRALCLVFPSKTEGFGLPVLEAMALGCPVISSDAASLPEVCGEAALYASPDDAAAWLAAIGRLAAEPMLRENLAGAGPKRSKAFSWRQGAEKYLELMFAVDHGTRDGGLSSRRGTHENALDLGRH